MKNTVINSLSDDPLPILRYFGLVACLVFALVGLVYPVQAEKNNGFCSKNSEEGNFTTYLMQDSRKNSEKLAKQSEIDGKQTVAIAEKVKEIGLNKVKTEKVDLKTDIFTVNKEIIEETPEVEEIKPDQIVFSVITAYTSTPGQTDDSPFIAASGKHVYDGMIAANGLPFGTKIKIPELYGDKIFTVDDRMNKRYGFGRMDIWLDTTVAEARKFGVKRVNVEIYYEKPEIKTLASAK